MNSRLPITLLTAFALAAPGATAYAKDKEKHKDKKEHKSENRGDEGHRGDQDDDRDHRDDDRGRKITICHIPPGNSAARHTISVSQSAWSAHRGHGDHRGACTRPGTGTGGGRFGELDVNNDGVISLSEWRGDRASFDRLDRNRNGVITRDEFSRF